MFVYKTLLPTFPSCTVIVVVVVSQYKIRFNKKFSDVERRQSSSGYGNMIKIFRDLISYILGTVKLSKLLR